MSYQLPVGTDQKDNALLNLIPGCLEALRYNSTNFISAGGSANAYTATFSPAFTSLPDGLAFEIKIPATNLGASTLNPNGLGAKNLVKMRHGYFVGLDYADLLIGHRYRFMYDLSGDRFILMSPIVEANTFRIRKFHEMFGESFGSGEDLSGYGFNPAASATFVQVDRQSGICEFRTSNSVGSQAYLWPGEANTKFTLGTKDTRLSCYCNTAALGTTQKQVGIGWGSTNLGSILPPTNTPQGIFFRVDAAGAGVNIFAVTKTGSSGGGLETTTNTGIADGIAYHLFEIVANSTQAKFYIDGALVATHTTNIPAVGIGIRTGIVTLDTNVKYMDIDWVEELIPVRPT